MKNHRCVLMREKTSTYKVYKNYKFYMLKFKTIKHLVLGWHWRVSAWSKVYAMNWTGLEADLSTFGALCSTVWLHSAMQLWSVNSETLTTMSCSKPRRCWTVTGENRLGEINMPWPIRVNAEFTGENERRRDNIAENNKLPSIGRMVASVCWLAGNSCTVRDRMCRDTALYSCLDINESLKMTWSKVNMVRSWFSIKYTPEVVPQSQRMVALLSKSCCNLSTGTNWLMLLKNIHDRIAI